MIKIGILGTDGGAVGGHALNICKILSKGLYDAKITALFGDGKNETAGLAEKFSIDFVAERPEDMLGKVDAVMVLPRHGDKHKNYAMPFIKAGLPVFIDKPFNCSVEDAEEIIKEAKKSGSIICGGSYIKIAPGIVKLKNNLPDKELIQSAIVSYPTVMGSPHGGLHFYSHHLIETMLTLFGTDVKSISAISTSGCPIAVANYGNFSVIMNFASNEGNLYAGVYFTHDNYMEEKINYAGLDDLQCEMFLKSVTVGTGENTDHFLTAVKVCNAVIKSLEEKREIYL
ncbi:MAG: Gfo/Idh/MocA family oxidoreductase [Monoglobales bacterium]